MADIRHFHQNPVRSVDRVQPGSCPRYTYTNASAPPAPFFPWPQCRRLLDIASSTSSDSKAGGPSHTLTCALCETDHRPRASPLLRPAQPPTASPAHSEPLCMEARLLPIYIFFPRAPPQQTPSIPSVYTQATPRPATARHRRSGYGYRSSPAPHLCQRALPQRGQQRCAAVRTARAAAVSGSAAPRRTLRVPCAVDDRGGRLRLRLLLLRLPAARARVRRSLSVCLLVPLLSQFRLNWL